MILRKEELPNLDSDTKDLVFKGRFNLYKIQAPEGDYVLMAGEKLFFYLNSSGIALGQTDELSCEVIESQVYFKDTYSDCININLSLTI